MPKLIWVRSRFKSSSPKDGFFSRLWDWFFSLDKFLRFSVITMALLLLATPAIVANRFNLLQHAANSKTATISSIPASGSYGIGQQFVVNIVIDGGGQAFNAAQATVAVSSNLTVQNLTINTDPTSSCNFTFVNTKSTPTATNPSFAGAILNGSSNSCILYSMTVLANAAGTGTITLSKGSVKAYVNSAEILLATQNSTYTLGSAPTPTPTPVLPSATPTPIPAIPTPTPTSVNPTPTSQPVPPPTIDAQATDTYQSAVTLTGSATAGLSVYMNNATIGISYPTATTWQYGTTLALGTNTFTAYTQDSLGQKSSSVSMSITLHKLGDVNGDGIIDLTDLSMFATDWENTGTLNYSLSDMNGDGIVDLTDFSLLAKAYGN